MSTMVRGEEMGTSCRSVHVHVCEYMSEYVQTHTLEILMGKERLAETRGKNVVRGLFFWG